MQLFGSLKLLMALLGSSCPLFGRSGPKMGPKMVPKNAQKRNLRLSMFFFFLIFGHLNFVQDKHLKNTDLHHNLDQHFCTKFKNNLQDKPSRAQKSHHKHKIVFSKPLKYIEFLHVFGTRDPTRETQETQETPKNHPRTSITPYKKCQKKTQQMPPW